MGLFRTKGLVLSTKRFSEADKIVSIFSPAHGRLEAVAKGARKSGSRLAGRLEPFNVGRFLIFKGKSIPVITQVEVEKFFPRLTSTQPELGYGLEALYIVSRVLEKEQPEEKLYDLTLAYLNFLEEKGVKLSVWLAYRLKVLAFLGYRLNFERCFKCKGKLTGSAWFDWEKGRFFDEECLENPEAFFLSQPRFLSYLLYNRFDQLEEASPKLIEEVKNFTQKLLEYFFHFDPEEARIFEV